MKAKHNLFKGVDRILFPADGNAPRLFLEQIVVIKESCPQFTFNIDLSVQGGDQFFVVVLYLNGQYAPVNMPAMIVKYINDNL